MLCMLRLPYDLTFHHFFCFMPAGAACVVFATHASYIAAVSSRFMQLVFGSLEKKVSHFIKASLANGVDNE